MKNWRDVFISVVVLISILCVIYFGFLVERKMNWVFGYGDIGKKEVVFPIKEKIVSLEKRIVDL